MACPKALGRTPHAVGSRFNVQSLGICCLEVHGMAWGREASEVVLDCKRFAYGDTTDARHRIDDD